MGDDIRDAGLEEEKPSMLAFESHSHSECIHDTMAAAEAYCENQRLRFTATRRRVLEFLLEEHKALGAYEILQRLADEGLGTQPSVAYRALEFLQVHGFVHKVERLNAYVACAHPHEAHSPAFMICRTCNLIAEEATSPARGMLATAARQAGFDIERTVIEAEGLCARCIADGVA